MIVFTIQLLLQFLSLIQKISSLSLTEQFLGSELELFIWGTYLYHIIHLHKTCNFIMINDQFLLHINYKGYFPDHHVLKILYIMTFSVKQFFMPRPLTIIPAWLSNEGNDLNMAISYFILSQRLQCDYKQEGA